MVLLNSSTVNLSLYMVQVGFTLDEEIGHIHVNIVIGIYEPIGDF